MAFATIRIDDIEPDVSDFETACAIMSDIDGRASWSTPRVLAQWVATVRRSERDKCLAEEIEHRRVVG